MLGTVDGIATVRVVLECARVDDGFVESAAHGESVAYYIPLALGGVEEEEFPEIVDEA